MENFSKISLDITKTFNKKEKKDNGIFFTPKNIVHLSIKILKKYNFKTILEPSCGSCEFIDEFDKQFKNKDIDCIEFNHKIFNTIKNNIYQNNNVRIIKNNFLKFNTEKKYDLIIGNPPYYVLKKSNVEKKYFEYFEGRPNIFILFIIKSFELLNNDGIICYVLPKSFLNSLYYNKIRKHIYKNYEIIDIIDCINSKFIETKQETVLFIIKNNKKIENNINFTFLNYDYHIFNSLDNIKKLKEIWKHNHTTLKELNFDVKIGNVVWNQVKNILSNDTTDTRLIYSGDLNKDNKLEFKRYKNEQKKNYIKKEGYNFLTIIINRGYGKSKYNFNYTLLDLDYNYLIENHLMYLKHNDENIKKKELKTLLSLILSSFKNQLTIDFINIYFGNNSINKMELMCMLPIFI